jgi:hypothetical protein
MKPRRRTRRERLEAAIEKAIALLDQLDGDPDLECSLSFGFYSAQDRGLDLEHEDHVKPPKGYMHPDDLCNSMGVGGYRLKP